MRSARCCAPSHASASPPKTPPWWWRSTLRFVPAIMEEADRIKRAQQARGLQFDHGGLMRRAQAFVPVLVPLFTSLFKRAERLACALEARCYTGEGRTHLRDARG